MTQNKSRAPDFHLKGYNKVSRVSSQKLGAGWANPDGSVSIRLDPCVVLPNDGDWIFTLFPVDAKAKSTGAEPSPASPQGNIGF